MPHPASPRQVVEALIEGVSKGAWKDLHTLFAEDAIIEYSFALPAPMRLEGAQAIEEYFAAMEALPLRLQKREMLLHETGDPEVVVAEWDYDGLITTTGRSFCVSNITVSRVRAGKIVASRDYHNHAILADALGRLPSLLAKLSAGAGSA